MTIDTLLEMLREEVARTQISIAIIEKIRSKPEPEPEPEVISEAWKKAKKTKEVKEPVKRGRKPMTAAQKKAVGRRMKKYWAEVRKGKR